MKLAKHSSKLFGLSQDSEKTMRRNRPKAEQWLSGGLLKQLYLLRNVECGLVALLYNRCVILHLGIIVIPPIV